MSEDGIRKILSRTIEEWGGIRATARKLYLSPAYLSDNLKGRRGVSSAIAWHLGYEKIERTTISYRKVKI